MAFATRRPSFLRRLNELLHALRNRPNLGDLYFAARDIGILRLNMKQMGYQLARQLEGKLTSVDCSMEPQNHDTVSKPTTQADVESAWFAYWCRELRIAPIYHRKLWEYAFLLQCLHEHGLLRPGVSAMGFGCGEEPIASYFASRGLNVLVTDLDPSNAASQDWTGTHQHASSRDAAYRADLVSRAMFDASVRHTFVDMNHIPVVDVPHDFCWSICAMEHLGTVEKGLAFVENSLKVIKPGGLAVHTTEYNYLSAEHTREAGPVVLFLRRHFELLARRLQESGHELLGPDFSVGNGVLDSFVDLPPYSPEADAWQDGYVDRDFPAHLKLSIGGYAATCYGLVIRKGTT